MKFERFIFVECNPDELLLRKIGISKRKIIHAGSKPEVCKRLSKSVNCVGIIDEDPFSVQPRYLEKLKTIENSQKLGIKVLLDEKNNNLVIILSPRLEEWIIESSNIAKLNLDKYRLPKDGNKLHKVINSNLEKFEKLLDDLISKSERLTALRKYISGR